MAALLISIAVGCVILGVANSILRRFNPFLPAWFALIAGLIPLLLLIHDDLRGTLRLRLFILLGNGPGPHVASAVSVIERNPRPHSR